MRSIEIIKGLKVLEKERNDTLLRHHNELHDLDVKVQWFQTMCRHPVHKQLVYPDAAGGTTEIACGVCGKDLTWRL